MSRSASKIRDVRSSLQKEFASIKNRRSVSVDTRARGSYIPDKRRPSSEERKSGNKLKWSGSSSRKSSLNLSEAKRKDVRPLTDKAYQKRKVSELVTFLDENGFSPPITTSKLMAPSRKDFENIFQFLYRCFDSSYEVKRIEEEAPKILKNLCYPFSVNKSAFVYVARTNWPSLLGVLIWLMDLNKFAVNVDMKCLPETALDEETANLHIILHNYICQCHHSGDNEEDENSVFLEIIKCYVLKENLDDLIALKEEKRLDLETVEKEIDELKALADHNVLLEKNKEKYQDYITKMKTHYDNRNGLCEQLLEELKLKESQLRELQDEVSKKQDLYDAQGFDGKKHLNYFGLQKKELSEKLENKRLVIEKLHEKLWEAEMEIHKNSEKANSTAEACRELANSIVESLKNILDPLLGINIPSIQHLCRNSLIDFPVLEFYPNGPYARCSTASKNAWKAVGDRLKNVVELLTRMHTTMNHKLTEIDMEKSEISTKLKLLSLEENKEEQDLNLKKRMADDEISTLDAQCQKNQEVITTLQNKNSELEKIFREMSEEKMHLQKFYEKKAKELKHYLTKQREIFDYFAKTEEEVKLAVQMNGNEIASKLQEMKDL